VAYVRPPFTGTHETSTRSADKGPHEGSERFPYGEDPFQRVVDINFGGGGTGASIFVSGDYSCYLRAVTIPELTLDQPWRGLGPLMFGRGGSNYGSTYAMISGRPTFLMCGGGNDFSGDDGTPYFYYPLIAISHDGDNWQTVFRGDSGFHGYAVYELVWDPGANAFYAYTFNRQTLKSRTGYDWTMVPDDFYSHCPLGTGDGVVGYDPDNDVMITPDALNEYLAEVGIGLPGVGFGADCTAFCNGIWMAGGGLYGVQYGSATLSSIDGGVTWSIVTQGAIGMQGNYNVLCITGGPLEDFPDEG
jgi:hypothetical protein